MQKIQNYMKMYHGNNEYKKQTFFIHLRFFL